MAIDIEGLDPEERVRLIALSVNHTTEELQAQGGKTLAAFEQYEAEASDNGFIREDRDELAELLEEGAKRPEERAQQGEVSKGITSVQRQNMKEGKTCRGRLRPIAEAVVGRLGRRKADEATSAALVRVRSALEKTASAGEDTEKLATQLALLVEVLSQPEIAAEASKRGANAPLAEAQALVVKLRAGARTLGARDVRSLADERADIIEGLTIDLLRSARRAARAAATSLGRPEIAKAFELDLLYNR
jgi:hypothetical protein